MAVPLAQVDDVAAIWRTIEAGDVSRVAHLIDVASAKLRSRVPSVDARLALFALTPTDPTALDPMVVANVVATIVKRVLVNPEGLASSTQAFGPISEARSFANVSEAAGEIQVTDADLVELFPSSAGRSKVRSTQIGLAPSMLPERRPYRSYRPW